MSQENVELVRGLIPPPEADVAALLRDKTVFDQMASALEPFIDPHLESVASGRRYDLQRHRGIQADAARLARAVTPDCTNRRQGDPRS